jgi:hypothetical protein
MSLKNRLARLERRGPGGAGRCPGCGFRPGDIRTIVVGRQRTVKPGEPVPPFCQVVRDSTPQPGRPRCRLCGGYMPPIALIEEQAEQDPGIAIQ